MKQWLRRFKITLREWKSREAPRRGAALAFYTILSLAPLLIIVVALSALLFGKSSAQTQVLDQFRQLVGDDGARVVESVLSAQKPSSGALASVIGFVTLLLGAAGVLVELRDSLNKLWDVQPKKRAGGILGFLKNKLLSLGMVLAFGFLLLVSLIVSAGLTASGKFFSHLGVLPPAVWEGVNFVVSLAAVAGLFALIFRCLPDVQLPWRDIWRGAALTAVLFTLGKTLIGVYLGKAGVGSAYGAAGSLVVLVVWIYYSAQIFFFGAVFTRVTASRNESKAGAFA
jgi:membrane protein